MAVHVAGHLYQLGTFVRGGSGYPCCTIAAWPPKCPRCRVLYRRRLGLLTDPSENDD
jgi:hypothetical protein